MKDFPVIVKLSDSRERRHPKAGEIYFWRDKDGTVKGPFLNDEMDGLTLNWTSPPDDYAIYKRTQ